MKLIGLPRVKILVIIIIFLVLAGLVEYLVIFHIQSKQHVSYAWLHNDFAKVEFENLPWYRHRVQLVDSVRDKFYVDQDNFEHIHDALKKIHSQNGEKNTKENINLAPQLLDGSQELHMLRKPPNVVVSPPNSNNNNNNTNKVLHVPEPPSLSKETTSKELDGHMSPDLDANIHDRKTGAHLERGEEELRDKDSRNERNVAKKQDHTIPENQNEAVSKNDNDIDFNDFELVDTPNGPKIVRKTLGPEILVEYDTTRQYRKLSLFEERGNNIMITIRTTRKYHNQRLPLLYNTWMTKMNSSNLFLITDGEDKKWLKLASSRGMHYILTTCGKTYSQNQLCCKAGIELSLMFKESNKHYDWLCHVDDDMYVHLDPLTHLLSKFNPKTEPVYLGRSGSEWYTPRKVMQGAKFGRPGQKYHFAVGGMYCLSRAMLELAKPYLVGGKSFAQSCVKTREPEDVTVGVVVGIVLNRTLSRTEMIYTHGLHLLSTVDPMSLEKQIAFSYGYGAIKWGEDDYNCIMVPNALYTIEEDDSQFKSLHCHLYPQEPWCVKRNNDLTLHLVTRQ